MDSTSRTIRATDVLAAATLLLIAAAAIFAFGYAAGVQIGGAP